MTMRVRVAVSMFVLMARSMSARMLVVVMVFVASLMARGIGF